jgi:anti-sigma factor RsiW
LTQTQLHSLLAGTLPGRESEALLEHALACDGCAALLWQANEALPAAAPPLGMEARILESARKAPRAESLRSYSLRVLAAMAAALILLFSGLFQRLAQLDVPKLGRDIQAQFTGIIDYAKEGLKLESKPE